MSCPGNAQGNRSDTSWNLILRIMCPRNSPEIMWKLVVSRPIPNILVNRQRLLFPTNEISFPKPKSLEVIPMEYSRYWNPIDLSKNIGFPVFTPIAGNYEGSPLG